MRKFHLVTGVYGDDDSPALMTILVDETFVKQVNSLRELVLQNELSEARKFFYGAQWIDANGQMDLNFRSAELVVGKHDFHVSSSSDGLLTESYTCTHDLLAQAFRSSDEYLLVDENDSLKRELKAMFGEEAYWTTQLHMLTSEKSH